MFNCGFAEGRNKLICDFFIKRPVNKKTKKWTNL